jgi:hypothetical protein
LATLRGNTQFKLHFVEGHPGPRMTRDFPIGHSTADTDDHGGEDALAGWLKKANYKYEFLAFAITMAGSRTTV